MKKSKWKNWLKRYLSTEIAIEYKACLYFYCIMVFYCIYLISQKIYSASVIMMCEMIGTAYIMGYLQIYCLHNFDEAEQLGKWEIAGMLLCSVLYTGASWLFGWFDRRPVVTVLFFLFQLFSYWCVYLINKIKRQIDTEHLNQMLKDFQRKENVDEKCD